MDEDARKLTGRQIIDLIKRGLSASDVAARLGLPTARFIAVLEAASKKRIN